MQKNVGTTDRIIRLVLAGMIAGVIFAGAVSGALAIALGVFAFILFGTGLIGWCGIYTALGINTAKSGSGCCGGGCDCGDAKK